MITTYRFAAALLGGCLSLLLSAQQSSASLQLLPPPGEVFTALPAAAVPKSLGGGEALALDLEQYEQLRTAAADQLLLHLPPGPENRPALTLELTARRLFAPRFTLSTSSGRILRGTERFGKHYTGRVRGDSTSTVSLSLLDDQLIGSITRRGERLTLARASEQPKSGFADTYLLYPAAGQLAGRDLNCGTLDGGLPYTEAELAAPQKSAGGCVDVYFELDYDLVYDKGGAERATAYLAALFNEVAFLYETVGVTAKISRVKAWDGPSPYFSADTRVLLGQFEQQTPQFDGDVAQLLTYQADGGIAYLDGLCHPASSNRMSVSGITPQFRNAPDYSWSVMVVTHELGHLFGSRHTHACVWNGNGTAIDGCAGLSEGRCGSGPIPARGGTIMSYCHIRSVGIDFGQAFGPQPGNVIANRVAAARGCLRASCAVPPDDQGDGNDGSDGDEDEPEQEPEPEGCTEHTVIVQLTLDHFGAESLWALRSEGGLSYALGGPYPNKQGGRIIRDTVCLPPGCYLFTMRDLDGDGMCCRVGEGRYEIFDGAGTLLGSGGQFAYTDVIDFCLGEVEPEEDEEDPDEEDCLRLDFATNPPISFGTNQDAGTVSVRDGGQTVYLENNAWKAIRLDYEATENTYLSFYFRSSREGEVHGIGLDNDQVVSANYTVRLFGTQRWGLTGYDTYAGSGDWQYFSIPIGEVFTGPASYLFFAADHDELPRNGNSSFRDVVLSEGPPCREPGGDVLPTAGLAADTGSSGGVYPNPTSGRLRVVSAGVLGEPIFYEVFSVTGQRLLSGQLGAGAGAEGEWIDCGNLPNGSYLLRFGEQVHRFTLVR